MFIFSFHLHDPPPLSIFFFFNDTATTEIYTLSLHDALPIYLGLDSLTILEIAVDAEYHFRVKISDDDLGEIRTVDDTVRMVRSEEHTSELQSLAYLVCRLLLEKKKTRRL